jgi:P27 family predicted phage terminase small subunit
MPNPPVPFALRVLRGNPGKRPLRPEPQPDQTVDVRQPPPFVVGFAANEWTAVATELHRLGLLTKLDTMPLAAYCMSYASSRTAAETLARMAVNDPITNGQLIKTKYGDAVQNPLVSIARKHAADIVRFASEFGLTSLARTRISAGPNAPKPPGKFDGLLG